MQRGKNDEPFKSGNGPKIREISGLLTNNGHSTRFITGNWR